MRKVSFLLMAAALILSACKESFKKGKDGLEYKLIPGSGAGAAIKNGEFMQLHITNFYSDGKKDSLLNDTRDADGPRIQPFDSAGLQAYYAIMKNMKKGDSLVIRISTDTLLKKSPAGIPPFVKKGHFIVTTLKLLNIFTSNEQADSAYKAEAVVTEARMKKKAEEQIKIDDKILTDYFAKNNIKAQKAPEGTYVEIISEGSGAVIDTTMVAKVLYIGKNMQGKTFDANMGPNARGTDPITVNMTSDPSLGQPLIKGWNDGMKLLKKGSKAKFYIPSTLAYGPFARNEDIPANAILIFDIEVADVLNKAQAKAAADAENKKMQEMQKRYMDSMQKLQADTSAKK